jgi:hypothetical protein
MVKTASAARKKRPYYAERFRQMIVPGCVRYKGGTNAVKHVLRYWTSGFERLEEHPHLTVEQLVISGEWDDLFDNADRVIARVKLAGIVERQSASV